MTLGERCPYTFRVIRVLLLISLLALAACATDAASRPELAELTGSVRALRAENARLEARLERLEQRSAVANLGTRSAPSSPPPGGVGPAVQDTPPLMVVRLKPKSESAPPLGTSVEVVEPPEGLSDELSQQGFSPLDESQLVQADQQYARGVDALKTGNRDGGIAQLQQFASSYPRHPNADNALYLIGLGRLAQKDWEGAARAFDDVAARYPAGDVLLDALLQLGECHLRLKRPREAKLAWERIVSTFPGTSAATQAQARLAPLSTP